MLLLGIVQTLEPVSLGLTSKSTKYKLCDLGKSLNISMSQFLYL